MHLPFAFSLDMCNFARQRHFFSARAESTLVAGANTSRANLVERDPFHRRRGVHLQSLDGLEHRRSVFLFLLEFSLRASPSVCFFFHGLREESEKGDNRRVF
jgi:hypothetical protein